MAEHCYRAYPEMPEGALAKVRAAVVNTVVLAEVALELDLGPALLLGRGEDISGGRRKASILANAVEAVIGAVYLDGGWDVASGLVLRLLDDRIELAAAGPGAEDFKTRLQELVLHRRRAAPLRGGGDGPRPRPSLPGPGLGGGRRGAVRARAGPRKTQSRPPPAEPGPSWWTGPTPPVQAGPRGRAVPASAATDGAAQRGRDGAAVATDAERRSAGQCLSSPRSRPSAATSTRRS